MPLCGKSNWQLWSKSQQTINHNSLNNLHTNHNKLTLVTICSRKSLNHTWIIAQHNDWQSKPNYVDRSPATQNVHRSKLEQGSVWGHWTSGDRDWSCNFHPRTPFSLLSFATRKDMLGKLNYSTGLKQVVWFPYQQSFQWWGHAEVAIICPEGLQGYSQISWRKQLTKQECGFILLR